MTETGLQFSELEESAKEIARTNYRDIHVQHDWWDGVYEDAVNMAAILGIDIGARPVRGVNGKYYDETDIQFSGFWSQGDGASFQGHYKFTPDAVEKMKLNTNNDSILVKLAEELTLLQLTERLKHGCFVTANIVTMNGMYSHSGCMSCEVFFVDADEECPYAADEGPWLGIFRRFADWIYNNLETEHDYLTSDEVIDQHLADLMFTEDGTEI